MLALSMAGLSDKEISAALGISIHTIRTYWTRIKEKAQKKTRAEVIAEASRRRASDRSLSEDEKRLAASDGRRSELESILGQVPALIWAYDPEGRVQYVNSRFLDYSGLTEPDALSHPWDELILPELRQEVREKAVSARARGEAVDLEIPLRAADGSYRWHRVREVPIFDDEGNIVRRVGAAIDIDRSYQRAQISREGERLFRMIADASDSGIVYFDPASKEYYSNEAYRRMSGSGRDAIDWLLGATSTIGNRLRSNGDILRPWSIDSRPRTGGPLGPGSSSCPFPGVVGSSWPMTLLVPATPTSAVSNSYASL